VCGVIPEILNFSCRIPQTAPPAVCLLHIYIYVSAHTSLTETMDQHKCTLVSKWTSSVSRNTHISLHETFFSFEPALNSLTLLYPCSTRHRRHSFPALLPPLWSQTTSKPTCFALDLACEDSHLHPHASNLSAQLGLEHAAFPSCSWRISLPLPPCSPPEACCSQYLHSLNEKAQLLIPEPAPRFLD